MLIEMMLALLVNTVAPLPTPQSLPTIDVRAPGAVLRLQVAQTAMQQERGLMGVTALPAHTGMLFVFNDDAPVTFWMKDTLVPLDMVFVSDRGIVRSVAARVPVAPLGTPDDRIPRRAARAKFVIELPSGEAQPDGLKPGIRIAGLQRNRAGTP